MPVTIGLLAHAGAPTDGVDEVRLPVVAGMADLGTVDV